MLVEEADMFSIEPILARGADLSPFDTENKGR